MGKKEDKKRLQRVMDLFTFSKSHLHDRACELDNFLDEKNILFDLETVGYDSTIGIHYITYISLDGNNFRLYFTEKNDKITIK